MTYSFFPRFVTRVLLSTFDGGELSVSVVTTSNRLAVILRAVRQVAPKGYTYAETIA
jgi:hypothetical protein